MGRQRSPKHASGTDMVPYLRAANVKDGRLELDDVLEMNFTPDEQAKFGLVDGDVLVTEGCGSIAQLGASAAWTEGKDGTTCFQNTLLRLRARPLITVPGFVEVWARYAHHSGLWAAISSGTNIFHIGSRRAEAAPLLLPPPADQLRIADLASSFDEAQRKADAVVDMLQRTLDAIERGEADRLRTRDMTALGTVADVVGGATKDGKKEGGDDMVEVPYLRVANVQRGHLVLDEMKTIRLSRLKAAALKLVPGDVLLNEGGDRDKLGRGWVWEGQVPDCVHQNHVFRARVNDSGVFDPKFISMWANTFGQRWFFENGGQTSGIASISLSTLKRFPVPSASIEEQRRVVHVADGLRQARAAAVKEVKALSKLRSEVVAQLLSGVHALPSSYDKFFAEAV